MRLLRKAGCSVFDQLCMVGANFAYGIMYARALTISGYGSFSILYALLVLVALVHGAAAVEAVCTVNTSKYSDAAEADPSIRQLLLYSIMTCGPVVLFGVAYAWFFVPATGAKDLVWFVLASFSSLFYWTAKGLMYRAGKPHVAAYGSLVAALVMLGTGFLLKSAISCSPFIGIAVGAVAGGLVVGSKTASRSVVRFSKLSGSLIGYARWSVPAAAMVWLLNNLFLFSLNQTSSIDQVAGFKAATTLLLPINQILIGTSLFLLPAWARQHEMNESRTVFSAAAWMAGSGVVLSLVMG